MDTSWIEFLSSSPNFQSVSLFRNFALGTIVNLGGLTGHLGGHTVTGSIQFTEEGYFELIVDSSPVTIYKITVIDPTTLNVRLVDVTVNNGNSNILRQLLKDLPVTYPRGRVLPAWPSSSLKLKVQVSKPVTLEIRSNDQSTPLGNVLAPAKGIWESSSFVLTSRTTQLRAAVVISSDLT